MGAVADVEFGKYILEMRLYRLLRQRHGVPDLLVRLAFGDQAQHRDFAQAQIVVADMQRDLGGDIAVHVAAPAMDVVNRIEHLGPQAALEQIARRPRLERAHCLHIAGIGGENQDACVGEIGTDRGDRIDAVHHRHLQVHQRHIGPQLAVARNCLGAVARLADHDHGMVPTRCKFSDIRRRARLARREGPSACPDHR